MNIFISKIKKMELIEPRYKVKKCYVKLLEMLRYLRILKN